MQAHQRHRIAGQQFFLVVLAARIGVEQRDGIDKAGKAGVLATLDIAGQGVEDFILIFNPALGGLLIFFLAVDLIREFELIQQIAQGIEQPQGVLEFALIAFDQGDKISDGSQGALPNAVKLLGLLQQLPDTGAVLGRAPDDLVDAVFSDPPFWIVENAQQVYFVGMIKDGAQIGNQVTDLFAVKKLLAANQDIGDVVIAQLFLKGA